MSASLLPLRAAFRRFHESGEELTLLGRAGRTNLWPLLLQIFHHVCRHLYQRDERFRYPLGYPWVHPWVVRLRTIFSLSFPAREEKREISLLALSFPERERERELLSMLALSFPSRERELELLSVLALSSLCKGGGGCLLILVFLLLVLHASCFRIVWHFDLTS